jgi:CheY-like chemotaxis protein
MAKLLMLDDEPDALAWMTAALETRAHEVVPFTSARAALEALETFKPDLIVADILMPEIDGLAFARLTRHYGVPILFVSIAMKQAEAVLVGAVGYVKKPASADEIRTAVARVLGTRARRNKILVVDDDPDVCEVYAAFLEPRFDVVTAPNGVVALDILRKDHVDLAVVDVHMPVMNGVELLRQIRADPKLEALPVIVQTSDRGALQAPVWGQLRAARVMDKVCFVDWVEDQIRVASDFALARQGEPAHTSTNR